jgi:hypothetical protein
VKFLTVQGQRLVEIVGFHGILGWDGSHGHGIYRISRILSMAFPGIEATQNLQKTRRTSSTKLRPCFGRIRSPLPQCEACGDRPAAEDGVELIQLLVPKRRGPGVESSGATLRHRARNPLKSAIQSHSDPSEYLEIEQNPHLIRFSRLLVVVGHPAPALDGQTTNNRPNNMKTVKFLIAAAAVSALAASCCPNPPAPAPAPMPMSTK